MTTENAAETTPTGGEVTPSNDALTTANGESPDDAVMPPAPRVDVLTIFPDYLAPLDLSLIGKARAGGLVDLRVADLREHAHDRHRTVDDAPLGGGAGMVMKPDVWLAAVESVADEDPRELVVLVPTPSGAPLTQDLAVRLATELAVGDTRAVVACGRYEGIDARVAESLREHPRVREVVELSLGDFVLNGGEVAALALLEAVVRLLPGVLGNPESVVEESFGDPAEPLLEYPVYTRPADWAGRTVPDVLMSGHHAAIARWRRDASLTRTARRRPDLLRRLDPTRLDARDREVLRGSGVVVARDGRLAGPFVVECARPGQEAALADVAAVTFPLACPDETVLGDVRRHIAEHLSVAAWRAHLSDPAHETYCLRDADGTLVGFSLVLLGAAQGEDVGVVASDQLTREILAELSKFYLLPRLRGTGAADLLMTGTLDALTGRGLSAVWLGTNAENVAAQRAYARHGFEVAGTRAYRVGGVVHDDVVMLRGL